MTRRIVALMMVMILLGTCDALTQTRPALYGSILRVFGMRHVPASGLKIILTKGDQGDTKYGDFPFNRIAQRQWGLRRMFLHSARLALAHPLTGKRLIFESPLPQDLADCLPRAGIR